jgi:hypothetical protein
MNNDNNVIKFFLNQASFLKYFIPMAVYAKSLNMNVYFCVKQSGKYNCIFNKWNLDYLIEFCKRYKCNIIHADDAKKIKGYNFYVEHHMLKDEVNKADIKTIIVDNASYSVVIEGKNSVINKNTEMEDRLNYEVNNYNNNCDYIVFPNKLFAKNINIDHDKMLFCGSPKFDTSILKYDRSDILTKYCLNKNKKYILIIYPKLRDQNKVDLKKVYKVFKKSGYDLIVKSRFKDEVRDDQLRGDHYFNDMPPYFNWAPYTSVELMYISDIIVNFDSTAILECCMIKKPVINFRIKPENRVYFDFLYNHDFIHNINSDLIGLDHIIKEIKSADYTTQYRSCIENNLFDSNLVIKNIFDYIVK